MGGVLGDIERTPSLSEDEGGSNGRGIWVGSLGPHLVEPSRLYGVGIGGSSSGSASELQWEALWPSSYVHG